MPLPRHFLSLTTLIGLGLTCAVAPVSAAEASPAHAELSATESDHEMDFRAGAFVLSGINTKVTLSTAGGQHGTELDLLRDARSLSVFRADASWRISGRHSLDATWYDIDRRSQGALDATIVYGGKTFAINTTIEARFRTNIYKLAYGYTLYRKGPHEITGLLGAHIMRLTDSVSATGVGQSESFSVTAPLPSFGLAWKADWSDKLTTRAAIQYFGITLDRGTYQGNFTDLLVAAEYRLLAKGGLGLGYNRFDLNADFKQGPLILHAKYNYNGLLAYAFYRF